MSNPETVPLIRYPRFKELLKEISLCLKLTDLSGEPNCLALEGQRGAGKTTLVKDFAAQFPRHETDSGTVIPVYYVETPSPVTVKGMASHMLKILGDPAFDRGTLTSMNSRLTGLLKDCGVKLAIVDDFHHLIDSQTDYILNSVSDWLKVLIKETGITFLVVGIETKVESILDANPQLARLFASRQQLRPFGWEPSDPASIREFAAFIKYVERARAPLTDTIPRTELLYRLHYATDGLVGHTMNLITMAMLLSNEQGQTTIDLEALRLTFDKRLAKEFKHKTNPFAPDPTERFIPVNTEPSAISPQKPSRPKKKQRVRDTLTTQ